MSENKGARGEALRLGSYRNISNSCTPSGVFIGVYQTECKHIREFKGVVSNMRCKKFSCSICARKNARQLMARLYDGAMWEAANRPGFRSSYLCKMFTLTLPGKDFRSDSEAPGRGYYGSVSIADAYGILEKQYNRLNTALKKRDKRFHMFKVVEAQEDGYPHFHVLMVGEAVVAKEILGYVRGLWTERYGMGNVDVAWKKGKTPAEAVRYIFKYLYKGVFDVPANKRVWSCSRGALAPRKRTLRDWVLRRVAKGESIENAGLDPEKDFLEVFTAHGWAKVWECWGQLMEHGALGFGKLYAKQNM